HRWRWRGPRRRRTWILPGSGCARTRTAVNTVTYVMAPCNHRRCDAPGAATNRDPGLRDSGVDALPVELVGGGDDELPTRVDVLAHEQLEDLLRHLQVLRRHPPQQAVTGVHRRLGQLVGIHLTETLVPLDGLLDVLALGAQRRDLRAHLGLGVGVDQLVLLRAGIDHLDAVQRRDRGEDLAGLD